MHPAQQRNIVTTLEGQTVKLFQKSTGALKATFLAEGTLTEQHPYWVIGGYKFSFQSIRDGNIPSAWITIESIIINP